MHRAMENLIIFIFLCYFSIPGSVSGDDIISDSPYSIIIDGGSTGSRLHIFEFVVDEFSGETDCLRRGSKRSRMPLSAFGRDDRSKPINQTALVDHIIHVFDFAAKVIPHKYHLSTSVKFAATAGMRLLDEEEQTEVYSSLYEGLMQHDKFVFRNLQREDILTLGGDLEGFYGAVAANFLKGIIDTNLNAIGNNHLEGSQSPIGALDMGGSSTQIVYLPNQGNCDHNECADSKNDVKQLSEEAFFSTSYLAYGVDQFRERLWDTWVKETSRNIQDEEINNDNKTINNPCSFPGYEIEWKGYKLIGTGNATKCVEQVQRLIPHHKPDEKLGGIVGGVQHPPIQGRFFAMSLYYFALDSLRVLSHPSKEAHEALNVSWPNPSIKELHDALDGLCSRSWHEDLAEIQHDAHTYTRADVLPHRCLESVYMVTLLRDGYGFHPESRDITFCFLVDGSEVEWSLGMALSRYSNQNKVESKNEQRKANHTDEVCDSHIRS